MAHGAAPHGLRARIKRDQKEDSPQRHREHREEERKGMKRRRTGTTERNAPAAHFF
jgi:hypothetical protein